MHFPMHLSISRNAPKNKIPRIPVYLQAKSPVAFHSPRESLVDMERKGIKQDMRRKSPWS